MSIDLEAIRRSLPGRRIDWHPSISSTMIEASRLSTAGCLHGTVVGADEQTAGVGRYGRHWHSEPDAGIYMSVVLRMPFTPETLPLVTLALGLAAAESIQKTTGIACDLRWPNDILIGGKKCCGILTQFEAPAVIAGIGINVNHPSFPGDIQGLATSLRLASGRTLSREPIIIDLLPAIDSHCGILEKEGREPILRMFSQASSYVAGRRVAVDQGNSTLEGVTDGLNSSGFLLLRDDQGKQHQIVAGGVRPCS
jgi:BirA family transcriptional regulator, biotin operon repressor / biotin---[acetyl-CoA-carboxylase] ligase